MLELHTSYYYAIIVLYIIENQITNPFHSPGPFLESNSLRSEFQGMHIGPWKGGVTLVFDAGGEQEA